MNIREDFTGLNIFFFCTENFFTSLCKLSKFTY
nr:MAG TPA: hypothetical protein [Caudoviricetes sp.]